MMRWTMYAKRHTNTIMIDTCNIILDTDRGGEIVPYLSDVKTVGDAGGKLQSILGKTDNYNVKVFPYRVYMFGSLCKYWYGTNYQTMTAKTVKLAAEKLGDALHLDVTTAKVVRLDVSSIIVVHREPSAYYRYLGEKTRFKRSVLQDNTLMYNTGNRALSFYDKAREMKAHGAELPPMFQGVDFLRYELRYIRRVAAQLKREVSLQTLSETDFYRVLVRNWFREYETITKINPLSMEECLARVTTPKQIIDMLAAAYLQSQGADYVANLISDLKAKGAYKDPKAYTRLKNQLSELRQNVKFDRQRAAMLDELNGGIKEIVAAYL